MEAAILAALPGTYREIVGVTATNGSRHGPVHELKVDRELQKLRKAGKIAWSRRGREIIWFKKTGEKAFHD